MIRPHREGQENISEGVVITYTFLASQTFFNLHVILVTLEKLACEFLLLDSRNLSRTKSQL